MSDDNIPQWPFPVREQHQESLLENTMAERDLYKEYYEAKVAWEAAQEPSAPNQNFLPAAERYQKAHVAVKVHRGELRED